MKPPEWQTPDMDSLRAPEVVGFEQLFEHHKVSRRGVLHVGAYLGQELETYLALGFERVTYVEANPELWPPLEDHLNFWRDWFKVWSERFRGRAPVIELIKAAASERATTSQLYLTECRGQASLLQPSDPDIRRVGKLEVSTGCLDELVSDVDNYSLMVMDIQGAELCALRGACKLLERLRMVVVEVNFKRRYEGCPLAAEVEDFMVARGYRPVVRGRMHPGVVASDFAYVRGSR